MRKQFWRGLAAGWTALFCLSLLPGTARAVDYETEKAVAALWQAAPRPAVSIPLLKQTPTLDGVLDDPVWQQATQVDAFKNIRYGLMRGQEKLTTGYSLSDAQTTVYAFRTADALYVAYKAEEPEIEALHLDYMKRDGRLWANDCVELFIQTRPTLIYQFITDANGSLFDMKYEGPKKDRGWNLADADKNFAGKVHKNAQDLKKSYWVVEARIPLEQIGGAPKAGAVWRGNFCRERYAPRYKNYGELSSWSGTLAGFAEDKYYGDWTFGAIAWRAPRVTTATDLSHPFLGRNTAQVEVINHGAAPVTLTTEIVLTTASGSRTAATKQVRLDPGKQQIVSLDYTIKQEGVGFTALVLKDGKQMVACSRLPFRSERIGQTIAEGIGNAEALRDRSDPESEFGKSVTPYLTELREMQKTYTARKEVLVDQQASAQSVQAWRKLNQTVRGALRAGSYLVWTCSPSLPVGHHTYPGKLKNISSLSVNACINEYENTVVNITNFTRDHMDFYVKGNIPHAACNPRGGFPVPIRRVLEQHARELHWTVSPKEVSTEDDGLSMPLLDLGKHPVIHVPPFSTRQIWYTTHTKDAKPTVGRGRRGRPYGASVTVIPISHNIAAQRVGIQLNVYDFRIPDIAELGSFSFNYSQPIEFLTRYKMNTFFLGAWPYPQIEKDGSIKLKIKLDRAKKLLAMNKPWKFVFSYGYTGTFMQWADQRKIPYMSDEWKRLFQQIFRQYIKQIKEAGLTYDDFVFQTIDEAHGHLVDKLVETTPLLREVDPKVRFAMTIMAPRNELERMAPHVDVWFNRNGQIWDLEFLAEERKKGKPIYSWHMSGDMVSPVLSWTRTYGWRAWRHDFDNISYFVFSKSAYDWQRDPIASRMLEAWRDTIEDWQYINALEKELSAAAKRGVDKKRLDDVRAELDKLVETVIPKKDRYFPPETQETADHIEAARVRIAEMILDVRTMKK